MVVICVDGSKHYMRQRSVCNFNLEKTDKPNCTDYKAVFMNHVHCISKTDLQKIGRVTGKHPFGFGLKGVVSKSISPSIFPITDLELYSSNTHVRLMMGSLKQKGSKLMQRRYRFFFLLLFQAFFFLVKTWRLHYPQCNSTADNLV